MTTERDELIEFFGEPISVYTSNQAEDDGILVSTGHSLINYITRTVFDRCIEPFTIDGLWEQYASSKEAYSKKLMMKLINSAILEIQTLNWQDWFYNIEVRGWDLFCAQNETGSYTLMFPEDY
jgi:hypothetical protein